MQKLIVGSLLFPTLTASVWAQSDPFLQDYKFGVNRPAAYEKFFRLGVLAGFNLDAEFSVTPNFNISRSQPGAAGVPGADHFYDDGYVRVDQTGNAQGYTSFWGYNSPDQVIGDTLTLHSSQSFAAEAGAASNGDGSAAGVEMVYGGLPWRHNDARIGWEFGFGWLPVSIDANHALAGEVSRTVHRFNTGGIIMPTAPYSGGDSGIGPTIRDVAEALPNDSAAASLTGEQTLDTDLFLFRIGPVINWDLSRRAALSVSAGGAVGFLTGDLKFRDTLAIEDGGTALNTGKVDDSDVAFGGFITTTFTYRVEEHGDLYLSLQYLPMSSFAIEGGGRRAELDMLGSVFISAGINWPF
jgi:hypothetical protein